MRVFDQNGHVGGWAFAALEDEKLGREESIALAEHLDSCDECMERYTAFLCEGPLMEPLEPLAPAVAKELDKRKSRRQRRNIRLVAAAMCVLAALWCVCIVTSPVRKAEAAQAPRYTHSQPYNGPQEGLGQKLDAGFASFGKKLSELWQWFGG